MAWAGKHLRQLGSWAVGGALLACSPAFDWREFSPDASQLVITMPCRPSRDARAVEWAGARPVMTLLACEAGGLNYSVAFLDAAEPGRVAAMLAEWRRVTIGNVQGVAWETAPFAVTGMTPNDEAVRVKLRGRLSSGSAVNMQAAYFVRGLRLYQVVVTGSSLPPAAVEPFFGGLHVAATSGAGR